MGLPGGLGTQLGISASEAGGFGVYSAPTRFMEYVGETMKYNKHVTQGQGLRAGGSFAQSARRVVTGTDASGDIDIEMASRGIGLILAHAMGLYPTGGAGPNYVYVFTPGDQGAVSFTAQIGEPQYGGTVTPKNLLGCKITDWTLSVAQAGILMGKFAVSASGYENSTALAVASYPGTYDVFNFAQGTIKVDGTSVANIRDWSLTVANNLNVNRRNLSNSGKIANQTHNGFRGGTGAITAEFTDTTLTAKVLNDAATSIDMIFTNGTQILEILTPVSFLDDGTPMVSGPGDIDIPMTFTVLDNKTLAPITITYTTTDATL
jgi:hypothetical protein